MKGLAIALLLAAGSGRAEPPAYIVAEITVDDSAASARDYAAHVEPIVKAHGGRYLARGGTVEPLEGAPPAARVAILAFPSMAAARAFHASPDYAALAAIRRKHSTGRLYLVQGRPPEVPLPPAP